MFKIDSSAELNETQRWAMILILAVVSLGFLWIIWPFSGAILWAVVAATVAAPSYNKRIAANPKSRGKWAGIYTFGVLAIIIPPARAFSAK